MGDSANQGTTSAVRERDSASAPLKEIEKLFMAMAKNDATDLHLKAGAPPLFRIHGTVARAKLPPLSGEQVARLADEIMTDRDRRELAEKGAADFAYSLPGAGRFRVNVFRQRGAISVSARRVKTDVPTLQELNLPPALAKIAEYDQGLVLVAGITGSGKSTTLAALIQIINETQPVHIVTIENPIEYLYRDAKAFVNQREVGIDVPDFHTALRYVMRQDPDVILIGEMRDAETFETALMAAETGHLVFGTIHCGSAPQAIGRVLDFFPPDHHYQVRQLLYFNLRAVIVQKLLKGATKEVPRVPAVEVMFCNPIVRKLIKENQDGKLPDAIRQGRKDGMQDFNQSLCDLVKAGLITEQTAMENSFNPEQLAMYLKGIVLGSDEGVIGGGKES
ncbi:MAG: PilT/PilU family type 4a pilus ATPase [Planctomycetota bacterium]|nr:PilT/PilU family type 4a pilus ATPase [Planctomycetota bacterium]